MGIVVVALLLLAVILLLGAKKKKNKDCVKIIATVTPDRSRDRLAVREKRTKRHGRVWAVLRIMTTYDSLMGSRNFYDLKNNMAKYNEAFGVMGKWHVEASDIETAIRFCRMENFYGICQRPISVQEVGEIYEWRNILINEDNLIARVLLSYKQYWDGVLDSYKRPSARKNRLAYLVDDLEEVMTLPMLQRHPDAIGKIRELQEHYSQQLGAS